jgi:hypothetical protein
MLSFWVKNGELLQEFFSLAKRICLFQNDMTTNRERYGCDKLNDRLMGHAYRIFEDTLPQNLKSNLLLGRESIVEAINENVRVNESCHVCRDPLSSTLDGASLASSSPTVALADVLSPVGKHEAATLDLLERSV